LLRLLKSDLMSAGTSGIGSSVRIALMAKRLLIVVLMMSRRVLKALRMKIPSATGMGRGVTFYALNKVIFCSRN
jgi:hypothetical protein